MATIQCPKCGEFIPEGSKFCPQCGAQASAENVRTQSESRHADSSDAMKKRVQYFLVENRQKLPRNRFNDIREELLALNERQMENVEYIAFKDPSIMLLISVFAGYLGVDRFMLGDTTNGIFKLLLTCCCGVGVIWWLIDLFKVTDMTINYNYKLLRETLTFA